ncbi:MAG: hypothetical protein U9O96_06680 [Candidatus Thermoplasmatota archaeon]|nr:hypothetical protein [Candidatus Thermoplasmatota archaeon]
MPFNKTMALGSITIIAEVYNPINGTIKRVEFYLTFSGRKYEYEPRTVLYSPPYEWKFDVQTISLFRPVEITTAAYYENAGGVAVDKKEVYIIKLAASVSTLHS